MNAAELGGVMHQVRRAQAFCLQTPDAVDGKDFPPAELADAIVSCGRMPFPSIQGIKEGAFPLDKKRPYLDLRRINAENDAATSSET